MWLVNPGRKRLLCIVGVELLDAFVKNIRLSLSNVSTDKFPVNFVFSFGHGDEGGDHTGKGDSRHAKGDAAVEKPSDCGESGTDC